MFPPSRPRSPAGFVALAALATCLVAAVPARASSPADGGLLGQAKSTASTVWDGAQDVAMFALGLIGVEYRFGGNTPEEGLDCSGLVRHVFQQVTGVSLPRTSKAMSRVGAPIAVADLKVGDLVFFDTRRFAYSHVGIYLGDQRFIHAPSRGSEVEIARMSDSYWRKHFSGARRLVGVLPGLVPTAQAAELGPTPGATPAR
jgi:cell wall-associated NlpC family hydrolase